MLRSGGCHRSKHRAIFARLPLKELKCIIFGSDEGSEHAARALVGECGCAMAAHGQVAIALHCFGKLRQTRGDSALIPEKMLIGLPLELSVGVVRRKGARMVFQESR